MKNLLLSVMMFGFLNVFASDYEQVDQKEVYQNTIESLRAERARIEEAQQKKDKEFEGRANQLTAQIKEKEIALKKINYKERLTTEYGQNQTQAKALHVALAFAQESKKNSYEYEMNDDGEDKNLCLLCCFSGGFIAETEHQKLAAHRLIDAIEGRDNKAQYLPCKTKLIILAKGLMYGWLCYPWGCYSEQCDDRYGCGELIERRDATYFRDGMELMAQEKLKSLKVREDQIAKELPSVVAEAPCPAVRSEIIEAPVEPNVIQDRD